MIAPRKIVLIPTYNEKENIRGLLVTLTSTYPDLEIWVIDDNSPDGTGAIVEGYARTNSRILLIKRDKKDGLGEAYKHALKMIHKLPDVEAVVTMDADGSHDPLKIRELLEALGTHDLAIGSRYARGGGGMKTSPHRNLLSQGGNLYARLIIGFGIRDSTAGFVAFRRSALDDIDLASIASSGYAYQIEFKNKLLEAGKTFTEVPITFMDRENGRSKMSGNIVIEGMVTPWRIAWRRILSKSRAAKIAGIAFAASFFAFTVFFSTYHLTESPSVWYDEGIYIQLGMNIAESGISGIRLEPTEIVRISALTVGYPLTYPLAIAFKIWGYSIANARLVMAVFLCAFVAVAYLLVRRLYSSTAALGSLALLATFGPLYGNGKSVLGEVPGLCYIALTLFFLDKFTKADGSKRYLYMIIAGLSGGLAAATKPYFLIFPVAVVIGLFVTRKSMYLKWKAIALGLLAGLIPIVAWMILQFGHADSATGTLAQYANPYHFGGIVSVVLSNVKGLFLGLGPLYLVVMSAVWAGSLWLRRRHNVRSSVAEIIAFLFSVISIIAFLRTSGMYRYIFPAQALSVIFFAPSVLYVASVMGDKLPRFVSKYKYMAVGAVMVCLVTFGAYQVGFDSWVAEAYDSHKTEAWQAYFTTLSASSTPIFFYNTPEVAIFKGDGDYFQYFEPAPNMRFGAEGLEALRQGIPHHMIIQTDMLKRVDQSLIAKYPRAQEFYKYSILRQK